MQVSMTTVNVLALSSLKRGKCCLQGLVSLVKCFHSFGEILVLIVFNMRAAVYGLLEQGLNAPPEDRYLRSVNVLPNGAHVIIALDSELAPLIHVSQWIMVDTTFKAVHGDTNEWKIVIWTAETRQREFLLLRHHRWKY
jgi:hypothetical protein